MHRSKERFTDKGTYGQELVKTIDKSRVKKKK